MRSVKLGFFLWVILWVTYASAQQTIFTPTKDNSIFLRQELKADTLFIGASFTRNSLDPVSVWFIANEAGWLGSLYFIVPKTGEQVFLFTNKSTPNVRNVLSDKYDIPVGDTVHFMYKVTQAASGNWPNENSRLPKYTGPNIPGESKFVSQPSSVAYGHRWSVAGRMSDSIVIFGFEDNVNNASFGGEASDLDFDDIVFGTTLSLASEEVQPRLYFTDKAGVPLAPGAFYSPANDTIYLTYTDDYVRANLAKDIVINVKNRKGLAAADLETITLTPSAHNGAVGTWTAKIPIAEKPGIPGDRILQTYFLGEMTATVKTHNRFGILDGNTVNASLNVAWPDLPETVKLANCSDSTADIVRTTTCIRVTATDQSFTRNPDTVWAEVKCDGSGDVIGKVPLIEQAGGGYVSGNIVKNETNPPVATDAILSCQSTDNITVTYVDEVYDKRATYKKAFNGNAAEGFVYVKTAAPTVEITQITDGDDTTFTAVIKAPTPTVDVIDQISLVLTSAQGDVETVKATETGPNTGVFTVNIRYGFQTNKWIPGSGKVEGYLDPSQAVTGVLVTGVATVNAKDYTATITLKPALNLAKYAYIKDANGDSRGDRVYIVFTRPLEAVPTSISPAFWNIGDSLPNPGTPLLSISPTAPNTLIADFASSPFPLGATGVPAGAKPPYATLPPDNIFAGQKPVIRDSLGPIIVSATIAPFSNLALLAGSTDLNVDTLTLIVSEAITPKVDWQNLVRFSKPVNGACTNYAQSAPVITIGLPDIKGNVTFTLLVSSGSGPSPLAGDCVYLNVDGTYTDIYTNLPPIHGEILGGKKPPREIELFRGYPPVAGMDASSPGFVVGNNDPHGLESEYSQNVGTGVYQTFWVPPADFPLGTYIPGVTVYTPVIPSITAPVEPGKDASGSVPMPLGIGAVQVISTGEYIADGVIFDNLGNFVKSFQQAFGYRGELNNQSRAAKRGLVSYLVWDLRNDKGQKVGQGAYVWKVVFRFKTGKQEIRYTRTGVMRNVP